MKMIHSGGRKFLSFCSFKTPFYSFLSLSLRSGSQSGLISKPLEEIIRRSSRFFNLAAPFQVASEKISPLRAKMEEKEKSPSGRKFSLFFKQRVFLQFHVIFFLSPFRWRTSWTWGNQKEMALINHCEATWIEWSYRKKKGNIKVKRKNNAFVSLSSLCPCLLALPCLARGV